ncbi:MAG: hypothetical protein GY749_00270 [Desulfobacteraceae bacterium]|nr:hypothetical protein [Desulfobacteraceae bacterium]
MKFWQSRVQCQNFISALLQTDARIFIILNGLHKILALLIKEVNMKLSGNIGRLSIAAIVLGMFVLMTTASFAADTFENLLKNEENSKINREVIYDHFKDISPKDLIFQAWEEALWLSRKCKSGVNTAECQVALQEFNFYHTGWERVDALHNMTAVFQLGYQEITPQYQNQDYSALIATPNFPFKHLCNIAGLAAKYKDTRGKYMFTILFDKFLKSPKYGVFGYKWDTWNKALTKRPDIALYLIQAFVPVKGTPYQISQVMPFRAQYSDTDEEIDKHVDKMNEKIEEWHNEWKEKYDLEHKDIIPMYYRRGDDTKNISEYYRKR